MVTLIDPWIGRAFSPTNLLGILEAVAYGQHDHADRHRIAAARERIATCHAKLDRFPCRVGSRH